jgi:hypothetical protein
MSTTKIEIDFNKYFPESVARIINECKKKEEECIGTNEESSVKEKLQKTLDQLISEEQIICYYEDDTPHEPKDIQEWLEEYVISRKARISIEKNHNQIIKKRGISNL